MTAHRPRTAAPPAGQAAVAAAAVRLRPRDTFSDRNGQQHQRRDFRRRARCDYHNRRCDQSGCRDASKLGATVNRLGYAIGAMSTQKLNTTASQSRIVDADMAVETSKLVKGRFCGSLHNMCFQPLTCRGGTPLVSCDDALSRLSSTDTAIRHPGHGGRRRHGCRATPDDLVVAGYQK